MTKSSKNQAKIIKKMYDALLDVGFTKEAATRILAAQGTGAKTSWTHSPCQKEARRQVAIWGGFVLYTH